MHRVLEGIVRNKRIASAYLFAGPPGAGKKEDALSFAESLGCKKVDRVSIEPDGASVKIEQIRELQQITRYGPSDGAYLVVTVDRADEMTPEAAAAFLKTLEEPAPGVVFILIVSREDRLPATIASRCQKIIFGEKSEETRPDPEFSEFYAEMEMARKKKIIELFRLSAKLEKEKGRMEELLYNMVLYAKQEMGNIKFSRILLEAVKNFKRKANLKLTLDVACLKMGGSEA